MLISFIRILKFAVQNFFRNFWLSFVTLTILFLALSSVNLLVMVNLFADTSASVIENQIDVTVYFKPTIKEEQVLNVQSYLNTVDGVKDVTYVSPQEALELFKIKHQKEDKVLSALDELGDNPLGATLVIQANDPTKYEFIISELEGERFNGMIASKDFEDYRLMIDRISSITKTVSLGMTIAAIVFALISILIVFNTIRVAIYTHRDEIKVMKLVGATHSFILAPYIIEGVLFAALGVVLSMIIIYPVLGLVQPYLDNFFGQDVINVVGYFSVNFAKIFGFQFLGSALITATASYLATKKYVAR